MMGVLVLVVKVVIIFVVKVVVLPVASSALAFFFSLFVLLVEVKKCAKVLDKKGDFLCVRHKFINTFLLR